MHLEKIYVARDGRRFDGEGAKVACLDYERLLDALEDLDRFIDENHCPSARSRSRIRNIVTGWERFKQRLHPPDERPMLVGEAVEREHEGPHE